MSRKLFITLLACLLMAGLAVQAVADQYAYSTLASTLINGRATSMVINGTTGYVLDGYGVTALNLTTPASPTVLGKIATPGMSYAGSLLGNHLIVADGNGLSVVDVTNTASMNFVGWLLLNGSVRSVATIQGYAFCAVEGSGLVVVNLSDPANPTVATTLPITGTAYYVTLGTIGGTQYAFVAAGSGGLVIVNVSNPTAPVVTGTLDTPGIATGVAVAPTLNRAYVADGANGVVFVDVTTPSTPTIVSTSTTVNHATQVAVGAQSVVATEQAANGVSGDVQLFAFDGTLQSTYHVTRTVYSTDISGTTAWISEESAGVEAVDITTPASPTNIGRYSFPGGSPISGIKEGNFAYIARKEAGLSVIDMTNLHAPSVVRTFFTGGECYDQFFFDNKIYTIDFITGNLVVINVTTPAAPESLTTNPGTWIAIQNAPRSMDFAMLGGQPYFYVGYYHNTQGYSVASYDLVNSSFPQIHSTINLGANVDVKGITLNNNKLFVSATTYQAPDSSRGVYIYDVTNPSQAPVYLGHYQTTGNARMTAISGNTMYVAAEGQGVLIVDITNPATPTLLGSYTDSPNGFYGVALDGNQKIFAAELMAGVTALDVSTPSNPIFYGRVNTPGLAYEPIVWDATHLLIADSYSLEVDSTTVVGVIPQHDAPTPKTFSLYGASPNPFNSTTMISFALPMAGKVDVAVFDAMGRQVATLYSGHLQAGVQQVAFNGEDLASGVYFLKVSSTWGVQTAKLVLLK